VIRKRQYSFTALHSISLRLGFNEHTGGEGGRRNPLTPVPRLSRARSQSLVQLGDPIAPRADQESRAHRQSASRRHSAMVRFQNRQRPHRGHQQPRSVREGESARSLTTQSHRGHLFDRWQNRPQVGHLSQWSPPANAHCVHLTRQGALTPCEATFACTPNGPSEIIE
jgi:hypothetical protein